MNSSCSAPRARCRPGPATTTAICCAGTARGSCSTRARARSGRCSLRRGRRARHHPDLRHPLPRRPLPGPAGGHPADQPRPGARTRSPRTTRRAGRRFFDRLRYATPYHETVDIADAPGRRRRGHRRRAVGYALERAPAVAPASTAYGYRLVEPDGRRMLPERLGRARHRGPGRRAAAAGRRGDGRRPDGHPRRRSASRGRASGSRSSWTPGCATGVFALADGADLLVIESTYLDVGRRSGRGARAPDGRSGRPGRGRVRGAHPRAHPLLAAVRRPDRVRREAAKAFDGEVVVAEDLTRVRVPVRRP